MMQRQLSRHKFRISERAYLYKRRIKAVIPGRKDLAATPKKKGSRGRPITHDAGHYRDRNTIEHLLNRLKDWRGIATRSDRTPKSSSLASRTPSRTPGPGTMPGGCSRPCTP